jgi:magnesium-transporting ATPase (P-type)
MNENIFTRCRLFLRRLNLGLARRIVIAVTGGTVLLVGIAMVVLPGPAILVIPLGLAILATEFLWAKRWLERAQELLPSGIGKSRPPAPMPDKAWHQLSANDAAIFLGVNFTAGLAAQEAASRLAAHGPNALPEAKRRPLSAVVLRQFASPLIYILLVAAVIAFIVGKGGDAGVILVVVLLNAVIGAFQEGRAERSMEALQKLAGLRARVLRDGAEQSVEAHDIVRGDILLLAAGDAVGADARLLECAALEVAEAALTGESLPVAKHPEPLPEDTLLADRANMVFSGTHIAAGRGRAVVVATALDTEVGKIASLTETAAQPQTPLELRITKFGHWLAGVAVLLFVAILAFGLSRGLAFTEILMVAISQMVSMVPEGLPVAMTIALAVGMQRMAAHGAIVRRLSAVETLGSTTVICSDKTGTLTRNEMTVTAAWLPDGRTLEVTGAGYSPEGKIIAGERELTATDDDALRSLIEAAALCTDAQLVPPDGNDPRWRPLGDPTEAALLTFALKGCVDLDALRRQQPRHAEIPFSSGTKMMATQHGGRVCIKGAPEAVAGLCKNFPRDGEIIAAAMGARALRVLAVAEVSDFALDDSAGFAQFQGRATFLGLLGQMDPPRDEVRAAVAECQRAGIRPVMVTGDHKATGLAVARALGIAHDGDLAVDGRELEQMPEQDLRHDLSRISVFARVHPAQKLRIVEAFQSRGNVVAMTGDGVNDAPALTRADVGVAMGITGTEVAKGAAKIVITDDNFATIVKAIEQGRLVYRNLKKVILFLFATSIDELLILLLALFLGYPLPLAAVQILWINLVTEGALTVNLVMERAEGDEMRLAPIRGDEPLITRTMLGRMALMVATSVAVTFGWFAWRLAGGVDFAVVQSETFTLLAVCQWFNALNCRSETKSALTFDLIRNPWLLGGLVLANALQFAVIYIAPMNHIFHTVPISLTSFLFIGAAASLVLWVEEARKFVARRHEYAREKLSAR